MLMLLKMSPDKTATVDRPVSLLPEKKTKPLDTKKITLSDNKILKIFTAKFYYIK